MNVSETITSIMMDGTTAVGLFYRSSDKPGEFWVEYKGQKETDGRTYDWPSQQIQMRAAARILLREMTENA